MKKLGILFHPEDFARFSFRVGLTICLTLLFVGVTSVKAASVKIGAVLPLTGWAAAEGTHISEGAKIAVDKINKDGGIAGRKLEYLVEDGAADPSLSLAAAQKLITRENVSTLFGAWLSTATLAIIPLVERVGVPFLVETSGAYDITHPKKKWVFRTGANFEAESLAAEKCLDTLGINKVSFIAMDNDYGRNTTEWFTKMLTRNNRKIVSTDFLDAATTDHYPQLVKIKGTDADTIIVVSAAANISRLLQQRLELGMKQKVLCTGGSIWPPQLVRLAGKEPAEGSWYIHFYQPWDHNKSPNPEQSKYYIEEWKRRNLNWDGVPDGARGWDTVHVIAEAIKIAGGSDNRSKIRDSLEKVNIKGITGFLAFDEYHDIYSNVFISEIKGGEGVPLPCSTIFKTEQDKKDYDKRRSHP